MDIFSNSRIKLSELYTDSINFVSRSYDNLGQYFSMASPMGQLLQVTLNLGKMIMYYIEDSITELNILTAIRPNSIKGLAALTGHNPSRAMSARGVIKLQYNGESLEDFSNVITIPNYTMLTNKTNGLTYTIVMSSEEARLDLTSIQNYLTLNVVQGTIEYQQGTGKGTALQSFNFSTKKGAGIDNYYVNVYVNGKKWQQEDSIVDMTFESETCLVKTGVTGGIDLYFGNGYNGKVPILGSVIVVEYLVTDGESGNIKSQKASLANQWSFKTPGYSLNNEEIDLNKLIDVSIDKTILFGTVEEPLYLTRLLAPNTSRSFVLANASNYIYFLRKLNMFTVIDAIPGFATYDDQYALDVFNRLTSEYESIKTEYTSIVSTKGVDSVDALALKPALDNASNRLFKSQQLLTDQKKDDNTVYLFLIPDVNKRIANGLNYYTAPIEAFKLSSDEETAILNLIEESGQRVMTVDNAILELQYPRFVLNMSLVLWQGHEYENVRESIAVATSNYFLKNTRRDRIPVSDIIKIVEDVEGVDSVNVWFDADKNNKDIYGTFDGIDDYGDIILERYVVDAWNNKVPIKDIYPLFRGDFESEDGVYYEDGTNKNKLSTLNIQVRSYTPKDLNSIHNKAITK